MTERPLPERGHRLRALLDAAGAAAIRAFEDHPLVRRKPDGSLVTDGDLAAERVILEGIRAEWPGDAARSEEGGTLGGAGAPGAWTIDPIDGTSAFVEGLAHWGPTVARVVRGADGEQHVDCGSTWIPRLAEHYHAEDGAAWFNGRQLAPLHDRAPRSVIYLPSGFHKHARLRYGGKARSLGGTAAHLALVARGAASAVIVAPGWSIWDTAAGLSLIAAVGGRALRIPEGTPFDPFRDAGVAFAAGVPEITQELAHGGRVILLSQGFSGERS
jgi:fructose-1,6-bisphosphatase/inositol monophosphatase family enzyme